MGGAESVSTPLGGSSYMEMSQGLKVISFLAALGPNMSLPRISFSLVMNFLPSMQHSLGFLVPLSILNQQQIMMKIQHDLPPLSPHPLPQEVEGEAVAYLTEEVTALFSREKIVIVTFVKSKVTLKTNGGKNGKPDWATKKDPPPVPPASTNALAAECMTSCAPTSVTLSHEEFAHLLKLAHERLPYHLLLWPIKVAQILYSHPPARSLCNKVLRIT